MINFSANLIKLRRKYNISQENLAAVCNVSRQSVSKWETGTSIPDIMTLEILAKHFGITIDALVLEDEEWKNKVERIERIIHEGMPFANNIIVREAGTEYDETDNLTDDGSDEGGILLDNGMLAFVYVIVDLKRE